MCPGLSSLALSHAPLELLLTAPTRDRIERREGESQRLSVDLCVASSTSA